MDQEIHFVTGKGGVGKSVVAAALAFKMSQKGQRVLLVELGDQSFYKDYFRLPRVGFVPVSLAGNLDVALWTGAECLREYAHHLLKVERLANLFFENPVMRTFLNIAPALSELAILGKITSGPRKHGPALPYDCVVVDAYATGHFLALLDAPTGMGQVVQFGPMAEQSRSIVAVTNDPGICRYHVVTLPEDLPIKESLELRQGLIAKTGIEPTVLLNKVLKTDISLEELQKISEGLDDEAQFAGYLKFQTAKKEEAYRTLSNEYQVVTELPFVFSMDPWEIIKEFQGALP